MVFRLMYLLVGLLSVLVASGQNDNVNVNRLTELQMVFRKSSTELLEKEEGENLEGACSCSKASCGCCKRLDIPKMHINDTACVNVTYLPDEIGLNLTFSIDGNVAYEKIISAKNPPAICIGIPEMEKYASICINFYNITIARKSISGCIKIQARLVKIIVKTIELGCFKLPTVEESSHVVEQFSNTDLHNLALLSSKYKQSFKSDESVAFH